MNILIYFGLYHPTNYSCCLRLGLRFEHASTSCAVAPLQKAICSGSNCALNVCPIYDYNSSQKYWSLALYETTNQLSKNVLKFTGFQRLPALMVVFSACWYGLAHPQSRGLSCLWWHPQRGVCKKSGGPTHRLAILSIWFLLKQW